MEDYKKLYEQTQRRMKEFIKRWDGIKLSSNDLFTEELKQIVEIESEDDKIRKALISVLTSDFEKDTTIDGITVEEIVAWLEKQKTIDVLDKEEREFADNVDSYRKDIDEFYKGYNAGKKAEKQYWLKKQGEQKHKFNIGDIISNNTVIYRVDNIVKNCIGQDCYFLVNVESEKDGTRYLKLTDSKGKTHNSGEITWLCEQVDANFEKQSKQETLCDKCRKEHPSHSCQDITELGRCAVEHKQKTADKAESMKHSYITTNSEFFQWIYDRLKYVYNENPNVDYMLSLKERIEDMQKHTDKVKPKFKVGDRITKNSRKSCPVHSSTDNTICEVAEVHDTCYILNTKEGRMQVPFEWQDYYELVEPDWSEEDENTIKVLMNIIRKSEMIDPIIYTDSLKEKIYDWVKSIKDRVQPQPKQELKKIEQEELSVFEKSLKHIIEEAIEEGDTHNLKADAELLLGLIQKPYGQRKECLDCQFNYVGGCKGSCAMKRSDPNTAWSEEDEAKLKSILFHIEDVENKDVIDWFKSLKDRVHPQNRWKPSNEQIIALRWILNNIPYNKYKEEISGLLEQIKKL